MCTSEAGHELIYLSLQGSLTTPMELITINVTGVNIKLFLSLENQGIKLNYDIHRYHSLAKCKEANLEAVPDKQCKSGIMGVKVILQRLCYHNIEFAKAIIKGGASNPKPIGNRWRAQDLICRDARF